MGNGAAVGFPGSADDGKSPGEARRDICSLALASGRSKSKIGFRVVDSVG